MKTRVLFLLTIPIIALLLSGYKNPGCPDGNHTWIDGTCTRCHEDLTTLESIQKICKLKATCETDLKACSVIIDTDHNPYDVEYDYGNVYKNYIDMCDWSLIFDADYYIKNFPMLATLYNNDKALLLEHFQTVGIHEGRQGCKKFNLTAYLYNCDYKVYQAFKSDYEGYYIYYMLHYDQEKNIDTINPPKDKVAKKQYRMVKTAVQSQELSMINKYRADVNAPDVVLDSELSALANYRAYINSKENWYGHDWAIQKKSKLEALIYKIGPIDYQFGENNVTTNAGTYHLKKGGNVNARKYYKSPEHYECMVSTKYNYCGVSNDYIGTNHKTNTFKKDSLYEGSQFDIYLNKVNTALNQ